MAFTYFLNIEPLSLQIAKENIEIMTNNNVDKYDDPFCNRDDFGNNIKHGFVAITMLTSFVESVLNDIIREFISSSSKKHLNLPFYNKIRFISDNFNVDQNKLEDEKCYLAYDEMRKLRNALIHYKGVVAYAGGIPPFEIVGVDLSDYFIKSNMMDVYNNVISFVRLYIEKCDLLINDEIDLFSCDGFANYQYITDKIFEF